MIRIGVIGQSGEIPAELQQLALEIGREIALRGAILLTGGTNGVMEFASKGAKTANGLVVGILPGDTMERANKYIDIPINTGLSFDYRSLILVHSSDALIMVGGGNGTLGELSAAYLNLKPVVILEPSGGWAKKVRAMAYEEAYLDDRKSTKLDYAQTVKEALDIAMIRVSKGNNPSLG
ncbi:TIGR00725 family protein [Desulfosporosinus orientis DSM 765]|uniref:TIGR00725 family protein n=1 Tax=Desulfosporosinus orientis (strain ATCC 19365 / DSM 765 / NCIMB 8382 / VKM B-1628 / Singapore I) TaxID=768706 RepID=G7WGZ5_DESOD|nr:TIGR00725 family protein [Desulfosporosinus orientis]AET69009.1 TIGR00725 family protein [Desulfosporosinus orientis DSM 765]